jgi:hypothetical protein
LQQCLCAMSKACCARIKKITAQCNRLRASFFLKFHFLHVPFLECAAR